MKQNKKDFFCRFFLNPNEITDFVVIKFGTCISKEYSIVFCKYVKCDSDYNKSCVNIHGAIHNEKDKQIHLEKLFRLVNVLESGIKAAEKRLNDIQFRDFLWGQNPEGYDSSVLFSVKKKKTILEIASCNNYLKFEIVDIEPIKELQEHIIKLIEFIQDLKFQEKEIEKTRTTKKPRNNN